jgi:CBS domain containing-hemolysin-like protein
MALALAALFIVLNGFFVSAEFALVKVRVTQLHPRVRQGDRRAVWAQEVISHLDRYLSVTQFGITLASLALGWIGEPAIVHLIEPATNFLPERFIHPVSVVIGFGTLTFAHVLFGELVPKLVAIQRSEATALFSALPLRIVYITFKPLLWVLEHASRVILKSMGLKGDAVSEGTLSEEEILGILAANAAMTPAGRAKGELVERVLRFSERTARHAMVPRVDVAHLPVASTGEAALVFLRTNLYSRVVVTKDKSLDEVVGYLYSKDFLSDQNAHNATDLSKLMRDVLIVPESRHLADVLRDMQRLHVPIAVVVDEYGGTAGIVTMEDLLEEIVGEIRDELDEEPPRMVAVPNMPDAWDVDARTSCEEVSRTVGVGIGSEAAEPIGGVVLELLARIPRPKDRVSLRPDLEAEVTAMSRRRITRLRVMKVEPPPEPKSRRPPPMEGSSPKSRRPPPS